MNKELFYELNGKTVTVQSFSIEHTDGLLDVKMECLAENGRSYYLTFDKVSILNLKNVSSPFQICGFEILDYAERGYQKDSRYFVNDYENGTLSFYCRSFEVFDLF